MRYLPSSLIGAPSMLKPLYSTGSVGDYCPAPELPIKDLKSLPSAIWEATLPKPTGTMIFPVGQARDTFIQNRMNQLISIKRARHKLVDRERLACSVKDNDSPFRKQRL